MTRPVGAEDAVVAVDVQRLIVALASALEADFTKSGHLYQRVTQEHLGECSVKGCSKPCRERWALIRQAVAWIDANVHAPAEQLALLEAI